MGGCPHFRSLDVVRGMKLQYLGFGGCPDLHDLGPLEGMELKTIGLSPQLIQKGMDVLRRMKSLESIAVHGLRGFEPAEFWKLFDKGEFKK